MEHLPLTSYTVKCIPFKQFIQVNKEHLFWIVYDLNPTKFQIMTIVNNKIIYDSLPVLPPYCFFDSCLYVCPKQIKFVYQKHYQLHTYS